MNDPLIFSYQSTPALWACYYDPEGPSGMGKTKEEALFDLWLSCDDEKGLREEMLMGAIVAAIEKNDAYAGRTLDLVKGAEVILGLWSETELDPEDDDYEHWMAAFNESVTAWLATARAALAQGYPGSGDPAAANEAKRGNEIGAPSTTAVTHDGLFVTCPKCSRPVPIQPVHSQCNPQEGK